MRITVTGKIERKGIGAGTWALVTEAGETYELTNAPQPLRQPQAKVRVEGNIRQDVMTVAMIGPVLEVRSYEVLP
ncbi:MAG: DUF5818 domain-containing protein [Cyanophyceae cyanobacterium]